MKAKYITVLLIVAGFIIYIFIHDFTRSKSNIEYKNIIFRDTVKIRVASEPIIISKVKLKTVKMSDTVYTSPAFDAVLDTIIKSDTIKAKYEYPDNLFTMEVKKKPDSIQIQKIYIQNVQKDDISEISWWKKVLIIIAGAAAIFLLAK